jgi:putative tricarboxylic transport membrane protein
MTISNGDWSVFYKHPLSLTLLTLAFIGLIGPHVYAYIKRRRMRGPEHVPGDA